MKSFESLKYLPHLILAGQPGSGRRTALINKLKSFNPQSPQLKITSQIKNIQTSPSSSNSNSLFSSKRTNKKNNNTTNDNNNGRKGRDILIYNSQFYTELNPSFLGINDYAPIQTLVKEIASTKSLSFSSSSNSKNSPFSCRIILISEAEKLSFQAQQSLRRTMEKLAFNARFIFLTSNLDKMSSALKSRCFIKSFSSFSSEEIYNSLSSLSKNKNEKYIHLKKNLSEEMIKEISTICDGNFKLAIAMAEEVYWKKENGIILRNALKLLPDWKTKIDRLIISILKTNAAVSFTSIRNEINSLLTSLVEPKTVLGKLAEGLAKELGEEFAMVIFSLASEFDVRMVKGERTILHIEAFVMNVLNVISVYRRINGEEDKKEFCKEMVLSIDEIVL